MTRRTVVVSGTDSYDHELPSLPRALPDMDIVAEVFRTLGYEEGDRLHNPTADGLRRGLADWARRADRSEDVVVLYYTGHGERDDKGHFLMCRDSESGQLRSSAVESERMVEILAENGLTRILLILDTCYAGQGAVDALRALAGSLASPAVDAGRMTDFSYIAAARPQDLATDGAFATALRDAVADPLLGGPHQRHLHLGDIVQHINGTLRTRGEHQKAVHGTLIADGETPFFPNPRYAPGTPTGLDLAEQRVWLLSSEARRRQEERASHFDPRGRGSDVTTGTASYFTGRAAVLRELTAWLDDGSPDLGRSVLVTGGAGVGKSSLLGRLLLLSDPRARAALDDVDPSVPAPASGIDTAIHARHKLLDDIVAGVADAAGLPGAGRRDLLAALGERTERLVVLVDALDEAGTAGADEEPQAIARSFLRELAEVPCVRLLVGARPHVADALGPSFTRIDLADPRWLGPGDIERYARKLLLAPDGEGSSGPYTAESAAPVAEAVSARAGDNYLCARLIARPLARRAHPLDTAAEGWERQLPTLTQQIARPGVEAAFGWALRERMPRQEERARALLTPLAFAEGQGVPATGVWQAMATAVLGAPVSPEEIRRALSADGELTELIVEDTDAAGRSVYRLYHESFADALREQAAPGTGERIAEALLELVPVEKGVRDWSLADPYLKAHAATHAARAGLLDELVLDPQFLLTAEPVALQRALPAVSRPESVAARAAYLRCAPILASRRLDVEARAAQLQMAALQENAQSLTKAIMSRFPDRPWQVLWMTAASASYRALGDPEAMVSDVVVAKRDGREVIVTLEERGRLRVWDSATGEELAGFSLPPTVSPVAIAACGDTEEPWLLVRCERPARGILVMDVQTGLPLGPRLDTTASAHAVTAAEWDGTCVVAVGEASVVRLVDGFTGRELARVGELPEPEGTETVQVALGRRDGQMVLAAAVGQRDRYVLDSGRPCRVITWWLDPHHDWSVARRYRFKGRGPKVLALAVLRGAVHVATTAKYRRFESYKDKHLRHAPDVTEWYSPGTTDEVRAFVAGDGATTWCVRDLDVVLELQTPDGGPPARVPTGGATKACAVALAPTGRTELVTVGNGRGVRVWDVSIGQSAGKPRRVHRGLGTHCVAARFEGKRVLAVGGAGVRFHDAYTGQQVGAFHGAPYWLGRTADADLPPVLHDTLGGTLSRCAARVLDTDGGSRIRLDGSRSANVSHLTVVRSGGRRLLAGVKDKGAAVVLWDLQGKEVQRWTGDASLWDTDLRTVEAGGVLWLCHVQRPLITARRVVSVFRYPEESTVRQGNPVPLEDRSIGALDLGKWRGRASVAYLSDQDRGSLLVEDLAEPRRVEGWKLPAVHITDLIFVGTRDVLVAVTRDERLLLFAPGSAVPVGDVYVGSEIWSVAPVDDQVIGVATANGLFALQLPPP
ncbi:caspase family protein [Streptomyces sp. CC219B]|uniref:caspase family protein n=1 Tax=Streptomyces sp. CC219B TaxID=3044574 RepID=UPI0024A96E47|nr:caspase family protein [Streptomyces sp. CC219B]